MKNTLKTNVYFRSLISLAEKYEAEKKAHQDKKQAIINAYGYTSNEYDEWNKEYYRIREERPFSTGTQRALSAWRYSEGEEVEVTDTVWDSEAHDFINAFREAIIPTFVITAKSTNLMENIHLFIAEGCEMVGACTIEKDGLFGKEQVMGIRFKVN